MGIGELALIFAIILLLFGAAKLPQIARALGESIREFKESLRDKNSKQPPAA
ncbi:MAG: twin-arginine translocase TatA/TatE family subunit [Candidatus Omnitrophica bacterium]|nr:twin-arginine translocase TatA/TatE family subunit [Candidatus Omnitrophota bacterium]